MNTITTQLSDVALRAPAAVVKPASQPFGGLLRTALGWASQFVRATDPDAARTAWLAGASDAADLERRTDAWEQAQAAYRTLPPAL